MAAHWPLGHGRWLSLAFSLLGKPATYCKVDLPSYIPLMVSSSSSSWLLRISGLVPGLFLLGLGS